MTNTNGFLSLGRKLQQTLVLADIRTKESKTIKLVRISNTGTAIILDNKIVNLDNLESLYIKHMNVEFKIEVVTGFRVIIHTKAPKYISILRGEIA